MSHRSGLIDATDSTQVGSYSAHWLFGERYEIGGIATDLLLFLTGCVINLLANPSPQPVLLVFLFYAGSAGVLLLPKLGGLYERRVFTRVFVVGFVMAGLAAVFRNHLGDLQGDATSFYQLSSGQATGLTLEALQIVHEGSLAIVLWRLVYDFFAALGFAREPYVGVLVNVAAVALSGAVAVKMARQVYGLDEYRIKRLALLFASCGLFWLFSAIHLRDAAILLAVTVLAHTWLRFLARPDLGLKLLQVVGVNLLGTLFLGFLRAEFVFVPIAMAVAGVGALMTGKKSGQNQLIAYVLVGIGLIVAGGLALVFGEAIQLALVAGQEGYLEHAADKHGAESLGMALIVKQPIPIRLVVGTIYLFVFPIPFWSGFQLESAYHLFKSFNAVFFYFVTPLLALAVRELWRRRERRTPALLFILFLSIGFTLAIAATSLETRHFGAFLAPIFVLALLPDLRVRAIANAYKRLTLVMLGGVLAVHALWAVLKVA